MADVRILCNLFGRMIRFTTRIARRFSTHQGVVLDYNDLKSGADLQELVQRAYGHQGLGILFVKNIPGYVEARQNLLPQAWRLATLPTDNLKKLMRPDIYHSRGWSCGVEQFHGKFDTSKGSFYMNCVTDKPAELTAEEKKHYTQEELKLRVPNVWVPELPQVEKYTKSLSKLMISVGTLLAKQIDGVAHKRCPTYPKNKLHDVIKYGQAHVGRLLHYFPFQAKENTEDDWCGWHNDHGALTALTSSMYIDKDGKEIKFKETKGGLFAKNRFSETAKISIPADMLAFQLGESTQILTGGVLEATPHCVVRSEELAGKGISRNTFALFMEPDDLYSMSVPKNREPSQAINKDTHKIPPLESRWDNGIPFKEFHSRTIKFYS